MTDEANAVAEVAAEPIVAPTVPPIHARDEVAAVVAPPSALVECQGLLRAEQAARTKAEARADKLDGHVKELEELNAAYYTRASVAEATIKTQADAIAKLSGEADA